MSRRWMLLAIGTAISAALLAAVPSSASAADRPDVVLHASGAPDDTGDDGAYAYDSTLVPAGAWVTAWSVSAPNRTTTLLVVRGLLADRVYGVHLHVDPCGAVPAAAGPHYQQVPDPVQPSVDPVYANPRNEVWLDVRTNRAGAGVSLAVNPWRYRALPGSVVLHAEGTRTGPGEAGMAGARVACLTLSRLTEH